VITLASFQARVLAIALSGAEMAQLYLEWQRGVTGKNDGRVFSGIVSASKRRKVEMRNEWCRSSISDRFLYLESMHCFFLSGDELVVPETLGLWWRYKGAVLSEAFTVQDVCLGTDSVCKR